MIVSAVNLQPGQVATMPSGRVGEVRAVYVGKDGKQVVVSIRCADGLLYPHLIQARKPIRITQQEADS